MEKDSDGKPLLITAHEQTICMLKQIFHDMMGQKDPLPPQAMVWFENGKHFGAQPGPQTGTGVVNGTCGLDELFMVSVRSLQWKEFEATGEYPRVKRFMCASEVFMRTRGFTAEDVLEVGADGYADACDVVLWGPSEAKEDYENNPATDWKQGLATYVATRDTFGEIEYELAVTPYWVNDRGEVEWDSCLYTTSDRGDAPYGDGPMATAMRLIMEGKD